MPEPGAPRDDRQYTGIWDGFPELSGLRTIAARVTWLINGGRWEGISEVLEDPEVSQDVSAIHPLIGIPVFACARFRSVAVHSDGQAWRPIDPRLADAHSVLGPMPPHAGRSRTYAVRWLFGHERAATNEARQVLEPLRDALLTVREVTAGHRAVLCALPWSVQTELIRLRFGAAFTQKTLLEKWRHIHEQPSRPWLFDAISQITGGLLTILTLVLGATRLVSGAFGWHPWGLAPWGPHWLAVTVTAVVVTAAVLMYLGVVLFDDHEWLLVTGIW